MGISRRRRFFILNAIFAAAVLLIFYVYGRRSAARQTDAMHLIPTWASQQDNEPYSITLPFESLPPADSFPWAATVSHHLLAHGQIDSLFREIAARRSVRTFFIISPSHWNLSTKPWSLADVSWNAGGGRVVRTASEVEAKIAKTLGVPYDAQVFPLEHGITTLVPYIARYFPDARVAALAVNGEPPVNQSDAETLTRAIAPYFTSENKKNNFLLISTDFSHLSDIKETARKDAASRRFFDAPSGTTWIYAVCDNRPGIYALARLIGEDTKCALLFHTTSYELSGLGADNVTSYYFSLFY